MDLEGNNNVLQTSALGHKLVFLMTDLWGIVPKLKVHRAGSPGKQQDCISSAQQAGFYWDPAQSKNF